MTKNHNSTPSVCLVVGNVHSGTTIISMLIGQHPDIMTAGALKRFPNGKQFNATNLCTCGNHPSDCELWAAVLQRVEVSLGGPDAPLDKLYSAISEISAKPIVLDCTHNADRLIQVNKNLLATHQHRLCIVLVERTAIEIADIQVKTALRKKRIKDSFLARAKVITRGILIRREILRAIKSLPSHVDVLTVNYHDLCRSPIANLNHIWTEMGLDTSHVSLGFENGLLCIAKPNHMIHGNSGLRAQNAIRLQILGFRITHLKCFERSYAWLLNVVSGLALLPSVRSMRRFIGHDRQ